jgi:hypothetical protein
MKLTTTVEGPMLDSSRNSRTSQWWWWWLLLLLLLLLLSTTTTYSLYPTQSLHFPRTHLDTWASPWALMFMYPSIMRTTQRYQRHRQLPLVRYLSTIVLLYNSHEFFKLGGNIPKDLW